MLGELDPTDRSAQASGRQVELPRLWVVPEIVEGLLELRSQEASLRAVSVGRQHRSGTLHPIKVVAVVIPSHVQEITYSATPERGRNLIATHRGLGIVMEGEVTERRNTASDPPGLPIVDRMIRIADKKPDHN